MAQMKFAHARFTTGNLKMRMRATLDFGTFSAPLRAPEAEAQTPKAHAQSAVRVRREARAWRWWCKDTRKRQPV